MNGISASSRRPAAIFPAVAVLGLLIPASPAAPPDGWPQFRGPDGQGRAASADLPLKWSEEENIAWKTPIPGRGWSSPVIEGGQVWVTTAIETAAGEEEARRRAAAIGSSQPLSAALKVSLRAVGLEAESGRILSDIEIFSLDSPEPIHSLNSHASPTPVIEADRLYCHFGPNGIGCADARSAQVLWRNQELGHQSENGPGGSPVVWEGLVIAQCDGLDRQFIAALDKRDGRLLWMTPRSGKLRDPPLQRQGYSTPLIGELKGRPHLITLGADWLYAHDPASGREIWRLECGPGWCSAPRPVLGGGMIYAGISFPRSEIVAVRADGDRAAIAWRQSRQAPQVPSPVLSGGAVYTISDRGGILNCLDAETGAPRWSQRIGGNHAASPLIAAGRLYLSNREGEVAVIEVDPAFKLLARNRLDGPLLASPAAVGVALYLRTEKAIYRIEEKRRKEKRDDP